MIIFLTVASGTQITTIEKFGYPYVLVSFMTKTNKPPKCAKVLFIDSGGFGTIFKHGKYTKTDLQYLAYVKKHKPQYFALRDYCCEPEILKKWNRTVKQHIYMTLEHHLRLLDLIDRVGVESQPVPVLQGWKSEDYLYCLDLFREHGFITRKFYLLGIGSICKRKSLESKEIIFKLRDELPSYIKLHGFGLSLKIIDDLRIWNCLYSVDTCTWDFASRWKILRGNLNRRQASETCLIDFFNRIKQLRFKYEHTKSLENFINKCK